jgi:hypothetical protein
MSDDNVIDLPPTAVPSVPSDANPEGEPTFDGVVVIKRTDKDGSISTDVVLNGRVLPTEAQTLLELGVQSWRQKIGLS